jgi:hypothetical protein
MTTEIRPESWWTELDDAVLCCLAGGATDPASIGRRLGLSIDAVTSIVAMLAREGKVRICLVAPAADDVSVHSFWCPDRARQVSVEFAEETRHPHVPGRK